MGRILQILLSALVLLCARPCQADVAATYNSASDVPVTANSFSATGATFSATLNFAPPTGTTLMVVKNTGLNFINGTFSNLAQGQVVILSYGGINYRFIANYYGGTGNDLVLLWAQTRPVAWGYNYWDQLGNGSTADQLLVPGNVLSTGVLSGKSVVAMAAGGQHSLALCSDGMVAAWGSNSSGQLGNDSTTSSSVPVTVNSAGVLSGKTVIAVAAGRDHSLALCSDGMVVAWGSNSSGQLGNGSTTSSSVPVTVNSAGVLSGKTVIAMAAGENHSLALCSDGMVVAWGSNSSGQLGNGSTTSSSVPVAVNTTGVLSGKTVNAVAAGENHSLALCSDGTVVAWGSKTFGQLGNSSATDTQVPVEVDSAGVLSGRMVVRVASGSAHNIALCSDGTIAAWGFNYSGQLGNSSATGSAIGSSALVEVNTTGVLSGKSVVAIVAGGQHNLALCSDGTVAAWGGNSSGQLGNNSTSDSSVPVVVSSSPLGNGERYVAIFSGSAASHNLGLIASPSLPAVTSLAATNLSKTGATLHGTVNPNGSPAIAQFEYGTTTSYGSSASVTLSPDDGLTAQNVSVNLTGLTPGTTYHYRLTVKNALSTVSTTDGTFTTATDVDAIYNSPADVAVTASSFSATGGVFTATLNFVPAVGTTLMVVKNTGVNFINGTFSNLAQGQVVTLSHGGINYRFIANYYGGTGNDLVLQWAQTRPVAWGDNSSGQLGNGSSTNRLVSADVLSTEVLSGKSVVAVAEGRSHTLALCSDGTVVAWGSNSSGQLGNGSTTSSSVPVAVNTTGVLSGKTVIAVAAGENHSLALCSDGTIVAWGNNTSGQLGNGSTTSSSVPVAVNTTGVLSGKTVIAVAAGYFQSLALCSDGTVATWGYNSSVPVAVNTSGVLADKTVIAISAAQYRNLALCSDGTVAEWNYSSSVPVAVNVAGVLTGKTAVAVAAGGSHSVVLCSDGTVAAWGSNGSGQLGNNSTTDSSVPVAVHTSDILSGKTVVAVAAGENHSLALCSDGTVAAWGSNSSGQLGNNSTSDSTKPVMVSRISLASGERYAAVSSGTFSRHNLGLIASPSFPAVASLAATNLSKTGVTLNGSVNPNGNPAIAQFEYGTTTSYGSSASVTLSPDDGLTAQNVSVNLTGLTPGTTYHYRLTVKNALSTVSTTDGTFTTGIDVDATYNSASDVPVTASSFSVAGAKFSATLNFVPAVGTTLMVVKNTGLSFISGTFSNLAQGQVVTLSYGGINYRFIANYYGGSGNDLVLQWAQTRLVAWGSNTNGRLGDNRTIFQSPVPVDVLSTGVLSGKTVVSVAAGESHSLALCSDGTLAAWGYNFYGQLGNGSTTDSGVPVAVNTAGVLSGKTVVAVTAGASHSLALCSDGTVAAWGGNSGGQLGNDSRTNSSVPVAVNTAGVLAGKAVVAVAAGHSHNLALCSDGTVAAWGYGLSGELGNDSMDVSSVPVAVNTAGELASKSVVAVAAGGSHSLALCSDGTIAGWGYNLDGEVGNGSATNDILVPTAVSTAGVLSGKTVVAIAAGSTHSLAICSDGTIAAWGNNGSGQLGNDSMALSNVPVAMNTKGVLSGKTVVTIAAGSSHNLALCSDGTFAAWGSNSSGQLGNNSTISSSVPVAVSGGSVASEDRCVAVFSGSRASHNFGIIASPAFPVVNDLNATNLTKTGVTLNAAVNPNGNATSVQFEYGTTAIYGSSVKVTLSPDDGQTAQNVSVSLSGLTPGTVYHYRLTASNAVSAVSTTDSTFTTPIDGNVTYNSVSDVPVTASNVLIVGETFGAKLNFAPPIGTNLMVVKNTGPAFINGTFSNLAQGQIVTLSYGGISYRFIANYYGGNGNDLVLQWARTGPIAWGNNASGQLGEGSTASKSLPTTVSTSGVLLGKTVVAMAAGNSHSLALCSDGTVAAWGSNSSGQLGDGSTTSSSVPVAVDTSGVLSGKTVVAVAAGENHSLALCSDGTVAAWGANSSGQLGNNSTVGSKVPLAVSTAGVLSGKTVVAVAAGFSHSLALRSDGKITAWGSNGSGQLGNGSTTDSKVPVVVNTAGVLSGKTVVAVAAGFSHSLALCSDGTAAAWGANTAGQLGNNSTLSSGVPVAVNTTGVLAGKAVIAVAAGGSHNQVLCSDGTVATWGANTAGQLGNNSTLSSGVPVAVNTTGVLSGKTIVAIASGWRHNLAVCSDGTVATWGYNIYGQLGNNKTTDSRVPVAVSSTPLSTGERYAAAFIGAYGNHCLALIASPPAPVVTSLAVTDLSSGSAVLNGSVNPAGGSASVFFDYGLDASYGSTVAGSPSPVTGSTGTAVSASLTGLTPDTTYHYRVRATSSGGSTSGADLTFTTPPDTTGPVGGTMTLTPGSAVETGAALTVSFASWTDPSMPLTYSVLIDDVVVSAQGASATRGITAPAIAGTHTLKGRIYDALGNFTEVSKGFTVITTLEEWRSYYFGSAQNAGDAADQADPDDDGASNLFEYVAGLDPVDPLSRFSVRVEMVAGQSGQKAISFGPLAPGRVYIVSYKTDLSDATWTPLTYIATSDNGAERTVTDLSAGNGQRFYRVEITRP